MYKFFIYSYLNLKNEIPETLVYGHFVIVIIVVIVIVVDVVIGGNLCNISLFVEPTQNNLIPKAIILK